MVTQKQQKLLSEKEKQIQIVKKNTCLINFYVLITHPQKCIK